MENVSILYPVNQYQTPINDELKNSLNREIWGELTEYIDSVPFIKHLISPDTVRGYAKDQPRDNEFYNGDRIIVDVTKPHILEDMDYFRERALFFQQNGKYTNIPPNPNPKSDYGLFWKEELRRWKYGYIRESDGEWIPGQLYFYWNYSPIWLVEKTGKQSGTKSKGERVRKFPKPWLGDYLFYHYMEQGRVRGKHGKLLKTRGVGFSFKMGSISPCNMFTLPGTGNPNFHLASEKTFLSGDKGIWGKVLDTLDWVQEHTPLSSMRLVDDLRNMTVQLGYKDATGVRKGLLSTVFGISLKDNPEKARGIRGPLIHYEEDGLFPNLEKAWNVNRKAVEDGDISFGYMLAGGTGGTEGGSFEGSEKLFYAPDTYNVLGLPNVYDKNANPGSKCGFFWGSYLNRSECFDEDTGEPDVVKALIAVLKDRYVVKYNSVDPKAITQKKAEEPITPQEAVMRTDGTLFPVADLKDYLETIKINQDKFVSEHYTGELIRSSDGTVIFKPNPDLYPIRSYDKDSQRPGCLEIFEMPRKNAEGIIDRGRYIFGIDPIDADTGTSLFSIIGMDTLTDRIVCEYTGRTRLASESYEIALRLLEFYNGEANYESNLKGLFAYFEQKNALHRLCDTPQILRDMDYIKGVAYGNKAKGTNASVKINSWGRLLQAQWQLTPVENDESGKLKMHTIRNIAYLEECIAWNADGNFDRVSAAGMLFILREDRYKRIQILKETGSSKYKNLADDNFFKKNYKNAIDIQPKHLNMGRIVK